MLKATKRKKPVKDSASDLEERLAEVENRFVALWGDMSSWWGVSRTMAEIHGLLFITGDALCAEEIQKRLGISRGNVSMNIRTLVEWGLVRRVHKRGDRRDYFESLTDVWEMFTVLAAQRKRREIDPVLRTLHECREALAPTVRSRKSSDPRAQQHFQRVEDMLNFLTTMERLAERFFSYRRGIQAAVELLARPEGESLLKSL
jgi:DNA-binding transcriptional regulator GbsR (MarR family)